MSSVRTFIAIEASADIREQALALIQQLREATDSVRWVVAKNLHWTLQFLGQVDELAIPEVCRCVARAARHTPSFALVARGVGAFPSRQRPRTLWLGTDPDSTVQDSQQMTILQSDIETALATQGYRGEARRFHPHLTLGRVGRGRVSHTELIASLTAHATFDAGTMDVDEVVIVGSQLASDGPVYHPMGRAPLGQES